MPGFKDTLPPHPKLLVASFEGEVQAELWVRDKPVPGTSEQA